MHEVASLKINVLSCFGLLAASEPSQAGYDTGTEPLTDGVVPFSDVEKVANLVPNHTLRFLPHVGHYYREEGSSHRLWVAIRDWLLIELPTARL